jgi:MATE family multidrug resistance protein
MHRKPTARRPCPRRTGAPELARELAATARLAAPMALIQLGQVAMMTTDLVLIGRLGDAALAAAALGQTVLFAAFTSGLGLVAAVAPLAAQAYGARQPRLVRRALRVGLWAAVLSGVPLTLVQFGGVAILRALGQEAGSAALAGRYLAGIAWALIPAWCFIALRNFMGAIDRPQPALLITLVAIPVNALFAYALIFGTPFLPALDLLGAGLATTIVSVGMCVAAAVVAATCRPFKKYRVLGRLWHPDLPLLVSLVRIGAPIGGAMLLEFGVFAAAALLMGRISAIAVAAHQIALQTATVLYMVPFGIALAATVRVGQAVGRGDAGAVRRAGFAAMLLAVAFMGVMTVVVALARDAIPLLFLGGSAPSRDTFVLASGLLLLATSFFIADGAQAVAAGALRGLNDTRVPLLFAALSFWMIGFASCLLLAFPLRLGAYGVWIGLALATTAYAVLLVWRFHALTARCRLPALIGDGRG